MVTKASVQDTLVGIQPEPDNQIVSDTGLLSASHVDTEDIDTPSIISEDNIEKILTDHRDTILDCLKPSHVFQLCCDLKIQDACTKPLRDRRMNAELLLQKIVEQKAYHAFLSSLEADTRHLGHRYIISLLRGTEFAERQKIDNSKELRQQIEKHMPIVLQQLDVKDKNAELLAAGLITDDEFDELQNLQKTETAMRFIAILLTKGPTAHHIFVKKVLGPDITYQDLCLKLKESRKRKATEYAEDDIPVPKRNPFRLKAPKGITSKCSMEAFRVIRKYDQMGKKERKLSQQLCLQMVSSSTKPLEVKIAALLESCNILCLKKQKHFQEVHRRVVQAEEMCAELHRKQQNSQALEGRCQWVLAKLYRCIGDYEKANEHIRNTFQSIATCEEEEESILANYCLACILLDSKANTKDPSLAIQRLDYAISVANTEDFGLRIFAHGTLRKVQAYLGTSSNSPGNNKGEIPQENFEKVEALLSELDSSRIQTESRTRCMIEYTYSDFYRMRDQTEEAKQHYEKSLELANTHDLSYGKHSLEIRRPFIL